MRHQFGKLWVRRAEAESPPVDASIASSWGAQNLTREKFKVVWAEFFNFKLGSFIKQQRKCTTPTRPFLKLKTTQLLFHPVRWSLSVVIHIINFFYLNGSTSFRRKPFCRQTLGRRTDINQETIRSINFGLNDMFATRGSKMSLLAF